LREASGFFFVVLLGLCCFLLLVYTGLNMVEWGIHDRLGLNEAKGAFTITGVEAGLLFTFAGRHYVLPWRHFGYRLENIFTNGYQLLRMKL